MAYNVCIMPFYPVFHAYSLEFCNPVCVCIAKEWQQQKRLKFIVNLCVQCTQFNVFKLIAVQCVL